MSQNIPVKPKCIPLLILASVRVFAMFICFVWLDRSMFHGATANEAGRIGITVISCVALIASIMVGFRFERNLLSFQPMARQAYLIDQVHLRSYYWSVLSSIMAIVFLVVSLPCLLLRHINVIPDNSDVIALSALIALAVMEFFMGVSAGKAQADMGLDPNRRYPPDSGSWDA